MSVVNKVKVYCVLNAEIPELESQQNNWKFD